MGKITDIYPFFHAVGILSISLCGMYYIAQFFLSTHAITIVHKIVIASRAAGHIFLNYTTLL